MGLPAAGQVTIVLLIFCHLSSGRQTRQQQLTAPKHPAGFITTLVQSVASISLEFRDTITEGTHSLVFIGSIKAGKSA